MNSGRNLNLISAGIIIYLLAGADFQSIGVSGLSWDIRYPQVIKLAAILFWFWMVIAHWLSGRQGAYFRAWVANSDDKTRPGVATKSELDSVSAYFGVPLNVQQLKGRFALAFVEKRGFQSGVYVCQVRKEQQLAPTKIREVVDNVVIWVDLPSSERYGLLKLHRQFPDVFVKVMLNDVDVLAHRVLPWLIALITVSLLVSSFFWDVSELSRMLL